MTKVILTTVKFGDRMRRIFVGLVGLVALVVLIGCTDTYLGRMIALRDVDVEDYRKLPQRQIPNAANPSPLAIAPRPGWMSELSLRFAGTALDTPERFDAFARANHTTAFVVIADGKVVDERYYNGYARDSLFKSFSISKSVLSALFGIARAEGAISENDRVGDHVPGIQDARLAAVKLEHLLDNVSGFAYSRGFAPWNDQPQMYYTTDVRTFVTSVEFANEPGSRFAAEDISPLLLGVALENALKRTKKAASLSVFASERLWQPMGASYPALWNLDRAGDGIEKTESGFVARAIDFARFGQLYLDAGKASGRQIVPADWVAATATAPESGRPNRFVEGFHRKLWWGWFRPGRTRDDFYANGHFGQRIYVSPDKKLVIVRMGSDRGEVDWTQLLAAIADAWVVEAK
jgi:CubicO group peptidase (beta-lactamase class C family)